MKNRRITLGLAILLFVIPSISRGQQLNDSQVSLISSFTKVWGFLKYYHPEVNGGVLDWDSIYREVIPKITTNSTEDYNQLIIKIIEDLGPISICQSCENIKRYPKAWTRNLTIDWVDNDTILSDDLSSILKSIFQNRYEGEGYYCTYAWGEGVNRGPINFTNERDYSDSLILNDYRYRLLALARYWNAIEYFFAYKYLLSSDWDNVLHKYIPILFPETSIEDYHLNITRLTREIEDSHSGTGHSRYLLRNTWNKKPPFDIVTIDGKTIVRDIRFEELNNVNDIRIGDEILEIDGKSIKGARAAMYDLCKASNEVVTNGSIDAQLLFGSTDTFNLKIERNGIEIDIEVRRYPYETYWDYKTETVHPSIVKNNYAYVNLEQVSSTSQIDSIMEIAVEKDAIIIDLRTNPMLEFDHLAKYFVSESHTGFQAYEPSLIDRGVFKPAIITTTKLEQRERFNGRIILIVNEYTQSFGESIAMFFQAMPNTVVVGSKTSGANGNTAKIMLPGNFSAKFSNIIIEYPDGQQSQKNGIKLDHSVTLKIEDVVAGRDPYMDMAQKLVNR